MLGNKKVMGMNIQRNIDRMGITRKDFAKAISVPYSSLTDWINGKSYPRIDKIEMMARYFGVQKSDLVEDPITVPTDGQSESYYVDAETRKLAQELHDDPELSVMLDAYKSLSPRDAKLVMEMVRRMQDEGAD
jgi:transcriptional regulator with XRE-family HTH domain